MGVNSDISRSLKLTTMCPLDPNFIFMTFDQMKDLGDDNEYAFTYYDGMVSRCLEDRKSYEWKEVQYGEIGLITGGFTYPPQTIVAGKDYSGKIYNFVPYVSGDFSNELFYIEPSVNLEIRNSSNNIIEAIHLGNFDIGNGIEDVALIKHIFAAQSGYDMNAPENVGNEIVLFNASNNKFLGQFKLTDTVYSGYQVATIIQKGDWTPPGVFNTQEIIIHVLNESNYSIERSGTNIILKKGNLQVGFFDFGPLLGGAVGATIVSGVLNPLTGFVTFTMSDASSFDVDFSAAIFADDYLTRTGVTSVKSNDIYQNLFVAKAMNASFGKGFYSEDLTTNYNAGNFASFPYPGSRDFVMCKYDSQLYVMIRKDITVGKRVFLDPNNVIGLSFFIYRDNTQKSMRKIAYMKILTRKTLLQNLSSGWYAFPVWEECGANMPLASTAIPFNETGFYNGLNESQAYCLVTGIYREKLPLRKTVTAPYTIVEEDNGLVLFINGSGILTVPQLPYGFACGIVQNSVNSSNISISQGAGVSIKIPSGKSSSLNGQYYNAYIMADEEYSNTGIIAQLSSSFILMGDLKDV